MSSDPYFLGATATERDRLVAQAEDYARPSARLLDRVNIAPGARALDVGCGPIGVLDLLSERVGPQGEVVGLERERRFVDMARSEIADRGLDNVTIVQADALDGGLERESFDLVHERLVLVCLPDREALLSEMVALTRRGGTVVVEDIDNASWVCWPSHPSWDVLLETFHTLFVSRGGDPFMGRRLRDLLRRAGIADVRVNIHGDTSSPGDYRRTHLVSLIDSIRDGVIAEGLLGESELDRHRTELLDHLADPATTVIDKLLVQAWGRKEG